MTEIKLTNVNKKFIIYYYFQKYKTEGFVQISISKYN